MQINFLKLIPYIIIIVLAIALSITQCSKQSIKDEIKIPDSTAFYKSKLAAIQAQGEAKLKKWHKDSLEMQVRNTASKISETKARKEADKALKKIADIVQNNPDVKDFVQKDSIADKAATDEKKALELDKVTMNEAFRDILHSKDEELKVSKKLTIHLETVNGELRKDVKRERRRKTGWKVAAAVLAVGIIYQSIKD